MAGTANHRRTQSASSMWWRPSRCLENRAVRGALSTGLEDLRGELPSRAREQELVPDVPDKRASPYHALSVTRYASWCRVTISNNPVILQNGHNEVALFGHRCAAGEVRSSPDFFPLGTRCLQHGAQFQNCDRCFMVYVCHGHAESVCRMRPHERRHVCAPGTATSATMRWCGCGRRSPLLLDCCRDTLKQMREGRAEPSGDFGDRLQ